MIMAKIRLPRWLRNKYVLILFFSLLWMSFFDQDSFYAQYQYYKQLHRLEKTQDYYEREIVAMDSSIRVLQDSFMLEKYAREHYLFKKADETLYIVP